MPVGEKSNIYYNVNTSEIVSEMKISETAAKVKWWSMRDWFPLVVACVLMLKTRESAVVSVRTFNTHVC